MQTLTEIRQLLDSAGLKPRRQFGQNFLIDLNHMRQLLELADVQGDRTVLEVGPGTGSLTEELLDRARRVVACEIDRGLAGLLRRHFADHENFTLIEADALASKTRINPDLLKALGGEADLVANLPYQIATPLVADCLHSAWRAAAPPGVDDQTDTRSATGGTPGKHPLGPAGWETPAAWIVPPDQAPATRFDRLTFTVQREVAGRLVASPGTRDYGPVTVLVKLLSTATEGPVLSPKAFFPAPNIYSQMLRLDFDPAAAGQLRSADTLQAVLAVTFRHRRKQIASAVKARDFPFDREAFESALAEAGARATDRAETLSPEQFRTIANRLSP